MGLESLFDWFQGQVKYALFFIFFIALIYTGFKRAWIAMVGVIVGLAFIGIFIINPEVLINLGEWMSGQLKLGQK